MHQSGATVVSSMAMSPQSAGGVRGVGDVERKDARRNVKREMNQQSAFIVEVSIMLGQHNVPGKRGKLK